MQMIKLLSPAVCDDKVIACCHIEGVTIRIIMIGGCIMNTKTIEGLTGARTKTDKEPVIYTKTGAVSAPEQSINISISV